MIKTCLRCGREFETAFAQTKYCEECKWIVKKEKEYARREKKKKERGVRAQPGYKPRMCIRCGKQFIPTGTHQRYCLDCREAAYREIANANKRKNYALHKNEPKQMKIPVMSWIDENGEKHTKYEIVKVKRAKPTSDWKWWLKNANEDWLRSLLYD